MYKPYQMQAGAKKGTRCIVCTGCGRCPGVTRDIRVVGEKLERRAVNLDNDRGERLVTVDIGTTTIAMQLHDREGRVTDSFPSVNPQFVYGADVLSRIQAAGQTEAACDMQRQVMGVLEKGVQRFQKCLAEGERLRMVLAANTTMVYLLMGWDPTELGRAPFTASHLDPVDCLIAGVPCRIFPGLSAFVGGDIVAGILASGMLEQEKPVLLVDLGTNGEMALGCRSKLYACATAAGPAFEGGVNRGIWGADMVRLLSKLRQEGILDESGLLSEPYFTEGVRIGDVCVTQESVRAVQLAKGAIAAGIQILTENYGIPFAGIDRVVLAGGFGYYLDPEAAAVIGLLPEELVGRTVTGGNTALTGALYLGEQLLQGGACVNEDIRKREGLEIRVLNLAQQPGFQECFLQKINF